MASSATVGSLWECSALLRARHAVGIFFKVQWVLHVVPDMRVGVLGGAGDMGFGAVRFLAGQERVEEVVVFDLRPERAPLGELGELRGKVRCVKADASKPSELAEALRKERVDSAVGAIGPFYELARPVVEAAIKSGVPLVDICDDYDGAMASLELSSEAAKAGVTCITGLGWTPGLSNLLAAKGHRELDSCRSIDISWVGSAADSKGLAVVMHVFHACTGKVPMYLDGELKEVEAGSGKEPKLFPKPFGEVKVFYTGHPEPVTIPKHLKVERVTLKGALVPEWQNSLVALFVKLGLTKTPGRKRKLSKIIHSIEDLFRAGGVQASGLRVDVSGELKGEEVTLTYGMVDRMWRLTSIPAALGAMMLASRELDEPGVHPPEAAIPAEDFLKRVAEAGLKILKLERGEWREVEYS
ncbi:MAG: hypothetical protein DRN96_08325 [Thermoproteota archaeon]|nr:MAG: hypothetical protein DRN96_08325 [Candidatus Korarchaeota archaeon]